LHREKPEIRTVPIISSHQSGATYKRDNQRAPASSVSITLTPPLLNISFSLSFSLGFKSRPPMNRFNGFRIARIDSDDLDIPGTNRQPNPLLSLLALTSPLFSNLLTGGVPMNKTLATFLLTLILFTSTPRRFHPNNFQLDQSSPGPLIR